ncbi:hypothetical protein [Alteromonas oceanisediminis]|uniref:hypothetical protein n=1 Tax=Alteromonas oceanisediminis TaxID=2836180 RepID=UPI001BD98227|nr:hypothetical protein [Alteromonas oceanisediminis]MBT0586169.1 hypothetical protein [Alteromonas oceanisediminis]
MGDILSLLIPIVGFVCLVVIVRAIIEGRVKRRFAETHASEALVRAITQADAAKRKHFSLKWGLLMVLSGVAFGFIEYFNLSSQDPGAYGLLMGAVGLGLLLSSFLKQGDG